MRLLQYSSTGEVSLTRELLGNDIPKYAILSHTWGKDVEEEVSFSDLVDGTGQSKPGYEKIRFCGEQARSDGLHYFWIDTCCINKSNHTELSEAINSMFQWYRNATKCYAYLTDVSKSSLEVNAKPGQLPWETACGKSKWFTRGWTLQELIAPSSVEFFTKEGNLLGDKQSLGVWISDITGIPIQALNGRDLSNFSIAERLSWQQNRNTTRSEDKAYSLLGICGIHMPLIYGEGEDNAFKRLHEEIRNASKGVDHEDFSVGFSLSNVLDIEYFVAREEELEEIHKALGGNGRRRAVVLYGLGGMGKTQLTVAYAKRHKDQYSAIFWLNISDEDSLQQSFAQIAKHILLEHPSATRLSRVSKGEKLSEIVDAVKEWLSLPGNTRWLLIYDNYDNPKLPGVTDSSAVDIQKYLPDSYQGSVIVTTRSARVNLGHTMKITKLEDVHDSLKILSNVSKRQISTQDADAVRLAKELDGFPLALATAGAYLHQVTMGFGDYHRLYKASWSKLQKMSPGLTSYEDRTLYSTWQISFDRVREQNKLSAMLLRLWAYFDSHDLWFELLRNTDADDPEWIRKLTEDEMDFHAAMRVLSDHGFVEVEMSSQEQFESRGYSIHGCVHSWTIHVLNQFWDHTMEKLSLKLVASHVPEKATAQWWVTQRRLLQHATRCTDRILNDSIANEGMEESLQNLGSLYADQGKLDQAEKMYQRALQGWEKSLGPDHASTITTVNSLGNLHIRQSKLDEAEKMFQRALQNLEITQGPDDISTLSTVNNLGNLYMHKGKLDKAEKMYQRAWQEFQKELGPDHASTLTTVNNLGLLYVNQGKLDEAEKMYQRALQMREKELGQDHTATLKTVNGLGCLYLDQGKLDEAEKMFQRALQGRRMALGPDHPSTLNTVHNLGNLYLLQGKLDEAEKMYQQALRGSEQALGQGTGSYIPALNTSYSLGLLYVKRGDKAKAREMYSKALAGYRNVFGADHKECRDAEEQLAKLNVSAEESSAEAKAISPTIPVTPQSRPDSSDEKKRELSKRRRILLKLGWK